MHARNALTYLSSSNPTALVIENVLRHFPSFLLLLAYHYIQHLQAENSNHGSGQEEVVENASHPYFLLYPRGNLFAELKYWRN